MAGGKLNIVMAASEMTPQAKVGGLADAVSALSKTLAHRGHRVSVVLPFYGAARGTSTGFDSVHALAVPFGALGTLSCDALESRMPDTGVTVYRIRYDPYYARNGIYGEDGAAYGDNERRFAFLSRAGLELLYRLQLRPDVIHVHDWHTALIPVFLNAIYAGDNLLHSAASVLTIHNMDYQGIADRDFMNILAIGWEHYRYEEMEFYGKINFLKGGISHADAINTVSPTYAKEIQDYSFGHGLDATLRYRAADLCGILNGVDGDEWNPGTDPYIASTYSAENLEGKRLCKRDALKTFGLPGDAGRPLIGFVSRLVKQKGTDILAEAIHRILGMGVQMVLLGAGEAWSHFYFGGIAHDHPETFGCRIGFDNGLAHKVIAGADFLLMPSRVEPCGLTQLYGLAYGTLPIVHGTGGLIDTVENFDERTGRGTGFVFPWMTAQCLGDAVARALDVYRGGEPAMRSLIRQAMSRRFTWDQAAQSYEDLYRRAIGKKAAGLSA